jgi:hypothetical protein
MMDNDSSGQLVASKNEMLDLLKICQDKSVDTFIVLDGIDECTDMVGLLRDIENLTSVSNLKFCLFSRPNIESAMSELEKSVVVVGRFPCADIRLYFSRHMARFLEKKLISEGKGPISFWVNQLTLGADGMFLWARLMVLLLASPSLTVFQRFDIITNVKTPETIYDMYDKMIGLISDGQSPDRTLAQQVLKWLAIARNQLSLPELLGAINSSRDYRAHEDEELFCQAVIQSCAGLVEFAGSGALRRARFIHLSTKEFLMCKRIDSRIFTHKFNVLADRDDWHSSITSSCLVAIADYPVGKSGTQNKSGCPSEVAFYKYAANNWIAHLEHAFLSITPPTSVQLLMDCRL